MSRRALAVLIVALLWGQTRPALQEPPPAPPAQPPLTFRVETNLVEVDTFVTDAAGMPVTGLTERDFQIVEDGKPQVVSAFSYVSLPVIRPERPLLSPTAIEPDVQSNLGLDGRIYLFVLDDLHVDFTRTARVRASLHAFFERNFGVNDVAAVVFTGGRAADGQDFTNNPRLLLAAVDKFMGSKLRSSTLERLDEYNRLQTDGLRQTGDPVRDPLGVERGSRTRNTMDSLRKLSDFMTGVHGRRKAMVLVSEGIDYDIYNLFDNAGLSSVVIDATREAIAAATRANVAIYAIDPRGLATADGDLITAAGTAADEPGLGLGVPSALNELRLSQDSLRTLSDSTGGFAVVNQNDFAGAFDRLVRENSSYYVLGYNPTDDRRDGKFRKIEVRVSRPDLMVRARRGYVAPRGRAQSPSRPAETPRDAALRGAVESPMAMGGIPMRLFAAPYKGAAPNMAIALAVDFDIGRLAFTERNGTFNNTLDVVVRVIDVAGKVRVNEKASVDLTLMPDTLTRARARGFRITSSVNLPPGRYQLRVSAAESGGGAGSVISDVEVPDFYKAPLAMSGVTITSAAERATPTARVKEDPVGLLLMQAPATARTFTRDDEITLFAEVYENRPNSAPHDVDLTTEVRADGGSAVFNAREQRSSTELRGGRGGYGYTVRIPLKGFAPGLYVVHVAAAARDAVGPGVAHDVQIRVR